MTHSSVASSPSRRLSKTTRWYSRPSFPKRGSRQLRDLERDAAELEIARKDHAWFVAALRDFAKVWVNMSPDNQGRFLRALIDKVVVDEGKGTCRVELIDFGAAAGTKEAA